MDEEIEIGIMEAFELLSQGKLTKSGYDLTILTVIEPIDFDMKTTPIIYKDFGFTFTSTDKKIFDYVVGKTHEILKEHTTKMFIHVEFDKIKKEIEELSKTKADIHSIDKILGAYSTMLLLTSPNTFHTNPYDVDVKGEVVYWFYAGTKKLEPEDIKNKFHEKIDWLGTNPKHKNKTFIHMVTKKGEMRIG